MPKKSRLVSSLPSSGYSNQGRVKFLALAFDSSIDFSSSLSRQVNRHAYLALPIIVKQQCQHNNIHLFCQVDKSQIKILYSNYAHTCRKHILLSLETTALGYQKCTISLRACE